MFNNLLVNDNDIQDCIDAHKFYPHARLAALYEVVPELTDNDLVRLAAKYANNHAKFDSFAWFDKPENSQNWTIYYTQHRDSTLLYQSNASVIDSVFKPYLERESANILTFSASHWAVGWIEGYAIRVYDASGQITPEFCELAELLRQLDNYPVLDESDYSLRESEATFNNVASAICSFTYRRDDLTESFAESDETTSAVLHWIYDNDTTGCALENDDDLGGYPDDDLLLRAFTALGYITPDYSDEQLATLAELAKIRGTGESGYTQLPLIPGDKE